LGAGGSGYQWTSGYWKFVSPKSQDEGTGSGFIKCCETGDEGEKLRFFERHGSLVAMEWSGITIRWSAIFLAFFQSHL
jgi:hypothetical protein